MCQSPRFADSSWTPGVFYICFYNNAHRPRLENCYNVHTVSRKLQYCTGWFSYKWKYYSVFVNAKSTSTGHPVSYYTNILNGDQEKYFWFFRYSGLPVNFKPLDLGVAVRIGLGFALRSLPLAGVAII